MTMKTKRGLAVGGGTVLCTALAILIATRFVPEPAAVSPNTSETSSTTPISVEISTAKREDYGGIKLKKKITTTERGFATKPQKNFLDMIRTPERLPRELRECGDQDT